MHMGSIFNCSVSEFVGVPVNKKMLLFVGRIEPLKGIKTLLRAIGHLSDNGQAEENLCLAVIGGELEDEHGNESEEMKLLCQLRDEYGLQDLVT